MNVAVFGIGYVGVVTCACLSRDGHNVEAVDISNEKVSQVSSGESPIIEPGVEAYLRDGVQAGRISASRDAVRAVANAEVVFVCVGSPTQADGTLDLTAVRNVIQQIGAAIKEKASTTLVVLRSTLLPGTTDDLVVPLLRESSGRRLGDGYNLLYHPEFLREGSAVSDYDSPPKIVIGSEDGLSGAETLSQLYSNIDAPTFVTSYRIAEAVKFADNAFHAIKITFANEIGQFCQTHGVSSRKVMAIFREDRKLNISQAYLNPGFAFGGSCLPKDTRALVSSTRSKGAQLPMIEGALASNDRQVNRALTQLLSYNVQRVGFFGLAFKSGTDDLRESPFVELAERLIGKGKDLRLYDSAVDPSKLIGNNRRFASSALPHLTELLVSSADELADREVIVLAHAAPRDQVERWLASGIQILDLACQQPDTGHAKYQSIV